jgi:hypothetical protein
MRFANLLPRDRNALCSRCNSCIESSDHILLNCEGTRSDAQLAISALKKYFNLNIDLNEFLTILQKDLRIRIFQIVSLYCSWNVRCKIKHGETIPPYYWQYMVTSEIKRFILRNSTNFEEWEKIIESFHVPNLKLTLVKIFSA